MHEHDRTLHERGLRALVLVAEVGRVDQAASALGHSPSAVNYQITCLEHELGVRLFIRHASGVRLTREGAMILPTVRAILALFDGIRGIPARSGRAGPAPVRWAQPLQTTA